jgi:hypothetical protein
MYPYLVPDGKGNLFVATSDGLSDSRGHLLWALKASGFTRLAPFQQSNHNLTFFSYQHTNHIDSHGIDGKVL